MIAPEKVRARAAEKEDENLAFRRYLKNHADEDELDAYFQNGMWRFLPILIVASVEIAARCTAGAFRGKTLLEMQRIWA